MERGERTDMIRGAFNANREAIVSIAVLDFEGRDARVETVIDTGFDGYLTLPDATIRSLGLTYLGKARARLADGSFSIVRKFEATTLWDDVEREVVVLEADTSPLLGIAMLHGHAVLLNVVDGGDVMISPL
jgi:clan AA aspartic protease